jgi:hypothetical protein
MLHLSAKALPSGFGETYKAVAAQIPADRMDENFCSSTSLNVVSGWKKP